MLVFCYIYLRILYILCTVAVHLKKKHNEKYGGRLYLYDPDEGDCIV